MYVNDAVWQINRAHWSMDVGDPNQWFIQLPPTPAELPPPNQPKKFWSVAEVYKMGKMERKWVKYQFSIEIFVCKFENFSKL